jgi:hypothetical protein
VNREQGAHETWERIRSETEAELVAALWEIMDVATDKGYAEIERRARAALGLPPVERDGLPPDPVTHCVTCGHGEGSHHPAGVGYCRVQHCICGAYLALSLPSEKPA